MCVSLVQDTQQPVWLWRGDLKPHLGRVQLIWNVCTGAVRDTLLGLRLLWSAAHLLPRRGVAACLEPLLARRRLGRAACGFRGAALRVERPFLSLVLSGDLSLQGRFME